MKEESSNLPLEDQLFFEYCRTGDRVAFERFYNLVQPWLKRMVYHLCADSDTTCDVLQETWHSLLSTADRFDPSKGRVTNLLFTIGRNAVFRHHRAGKRVQRMAEGFDVEDDAPQQAEAYEATERAAKLRSLIGSLRENYQSVLLLHYFASLEVKEIARIMDEPEGTIKTWLRRGRLHLAEILPREMQT